MRAKLLVIRLGAAAHHGRQRMARGAEVPASDPGALVDLDGDDLAVVDEEGLVRPVEVEIDQHAAGEE